MKRQDCSAVKTLLLPRSGGDCDFNEIGKKEKSNCVSNKLLEMSWNDNENRELTGMEIDDVIYGRIYLPADVKAIVETPQFQRLKHLRQMGFLKIDNIREYYDNRFHHCIGTYYAANRMLEALEENTDWLSDNNNKIPLVYRRAVEIAALLHDIGHGPFSHTWERVAQNYEHEKIGFACVDAIFSLIDKNLFPELRANENYGIRLIKALIQGKLKNLSTFHLELPTKFQFIFGIVSNEISKLDVDKWDYLKRDHFFIKDLCNPNMDFDDVFLKAKVSACGQHIEYRYEDLNKIYNLFAARWFFHKECYQSPRNLICDETFKIIIDELQPEINGHNVRNINAEHDMLSFLQLIDRNVFALVEKHPLISILDYNTKFQEVDENDGRRVENQKESFSAIIDIPSIAPCMNRENFHFYGDESLQPNIIDKTETIKKRITFSYDASIHTVFYSLKSIE